MKRKAQIIGLCVVLAAFLGCNGDLFPRKHKKKISKKVQTPVKRINGPLLAQVNNWAIGLDDFNRQLSLLSSLLKGSKVNLESYAAKKEILDGLVKIELLAQEAKRRGLDKEDDVKDAIYNYTRNLLYQKLINEITQDIQVTDAEIETFYQENKNRFRENPKIKIRELGVKDQSQARDLYIRILQGESFAELAKNYSVLDSAGKGGDLGYVDLGKISQDELKKRQKYWEKVLSLGKGEISNIFKDGGIYYIIKVEDLITPEVKPLSEVKDIISSYLKRQKENERINKLMAALEDRAKVIKNYDLLKDE